jgi:TonB family protein
MVRPVYPASLRLTGIEGDATVDFIVDPTGRVRNSSVVESTHPGFSAAAVAAVEAWRFIPASKDGHLVYTHMRVPVHFRLTNIRQSHGDDPPNAGPGLGGPEGDRAAGKAPGPPEPAAAVAKP